MNDELTALRARVAELEGSAWPTITGTMLAAAMEVFQRTKTPLGSTLVLEDAISAAIKAGRAQAPTPDPRDARIAELKAALRDGLRLIGEAQQDAYWRTIERAKDVLERALGDDHG